MIYLIAYDDGLKEYAELANDGHSVIFHDITNGPPDEHALVRCDAAVILSDCGNDDEIEICNRLNVPVMKLADVSYGPFRHITAERYPEQCLQFLLSVMSMYRLHLEKSRDYSPINILGTGEVGVIVRLWDKVARLMSLSGFSITVSQSATYDRPMTPVHESIDDNLIDAANYSIIGMILRKGAWGQ